MFSYIKRWYKLNIWTKEMVREAVKYGTINKEQYKDITGENY